MENLIFSAFGDELTASFRDQLVGLKEYGIHHIEPRGIDGKNISTLTDSELQELRKTLDQEGCGVSAIGSPIGKYSLDEDLSIHLEDYERVIRAAKILGTNKIRMFSFFIPKGENPRKYRDRVFKGIDVLLNRAVRENLLLCHENEHGIYGDTMKFVYDPCNFIYADEDNRAAFSALKPWVEYLHIKDATKEKAICPAGEGIGYIPEILGELKQQNRDIFLTLEPHLRVFTGLNDLSSNHEEILMRYQYPTAKEAFTAAVNGLFSVVNNLK